MTSSEKYLLSMTQEEFHNLVRLTRLSYANYSFLTQRWTDPGGNEVYDKEYNKLWAELGHFKVLATDGVGKWGYTGYCIEDTNTGVKYIVHRGTNFNTYDVLDIWADVEIALIGHPASQTGEADNFIRKLIAWGVISKEDIVVNLGHSMGGTEAEIMQSLWPDYLDFTYMLDAPSAEAYLGHKYATAGFWYFNERVRDTYDEYILQDRVCKIEAVGDLWSSNPVLGGLYDTQLPQYYIDSWDGHRIKILDDVLTQYENETQSNVCILNIHNTTSEFHFDDLYVVQTGDTLSELAQLFGITVDAICEANGIDGPETIFVGDSLIIPTQEGDLRLTTADTDFFVSYAASQGWASAESAYAQLNQSWFLGALSAYDSEGCNWLPADVYAAYARDNALTSGMTAGLFDKYVDIDAFRPR